ncbi:MAG: hypothetical protein FGM52_01780 [Mycobacterium sp.]|nr:hypothetical protein [Mycobacterium sp.]
MSAVKRGARVGVAAFALGLSLAGPQAAGTAAAEPADTDTPTVSGSQQNPSEQTRARTSRPADSAERPRRGRVGPVAPAAPEIPAEAAVDAPAGAESPTGAEPSAPPAAPQAPPASPGRDPGRGADQTRPGDSETAAASGTPAQSTEPAAATAPPSGSGAPSAALPAAAVAPPAPASGALSAGIPTIPSPGAAASAADTANVSPPPALAKPIAAISTAVNKFFDSTAEWLAGLPASPLTDFLEGALLLVRRTFFDIFPMLRAAETPQTGAAEASFTGDQMKAYLLQLAKQRYDGLFGQTVPVYGHWPYPEYLKAGTDSVNSDTNTQVDGVDEADFVENDGRYIYTAHNGKLTIVRADDLSVTSRSDVSGDVLGQFLAGDRLTVVSQTGSGWYGPQVKMAYPGFWAWNPQTTVTVYDVADRSAPKVVRETVFDGAYQSSRAVDGVVYVVMQRSVKLPTPQYTETPVEKTDPVPVDPVAAQTDPVASKMIYYPGDPIAYRTYESWDAYVTRVGDQIVGLALPHAYTVDADGNTVDLGLVARAEDIVRPRGDNLQSVLTVVSVDSGRAAGGPAFDDSVGSMVSANGGGTVYMTPDALYVATPEDYYTDTSASTDTRIDRFVVAGPAVAWQARGLVSGTLINQFAMDERDGHLRVASQTFSTQWADGVSVTRNDSGIYVLDTAGDTLDEVGRVTGLAPGERLFAVRYVGDIGYLVTFLQTDPLFAVDLSDPAAPTLLGELVVPGFSNYLQSVGDGLLLGIGQEREPGTWNNRVHATLFDVSDGANLTQIEREFLDPGYQWSWSDAQFDHHALLYSEQDGLLVVPVTGSGYDPQTGYRYGQYLKVLRVGPAGIESVGEIHPDEPTLRTVRIGDVLYAVGDTAVTAYRLSDLREIGSSAARASSV